MIFSKCLGRAHSAGVRTIVLLTFGAVVSTQAPTALAQAEAWASEVLPALRLYVEGDLSEARRLANRLGESPSADVRRDAAVVRTMSVLRSESREDVSAARSYLLELAGKYPGLRQRPEVLLALGRADLALHETTEALGTLQAAVRLFDPQEQPTRRAQALAALARAWALHNEWETTPELDAPRPQTPADAHVLRLQQVEAARAAVEELPGSARYADEIDLILAELLLEREETAPLGMDRLRELAAQKITNPAIAEAKRRRAARLIEADAYAEATTLLRELADSDERTLAREARAMLAEITEPQVRIAVPASLTPQQPLDMTVRVRNISEGTAEVRAFDLESWLEAMNGRLLPAELPESGSLVAKQALNTRAATQHGWATTALPDESAASLHAGAYVVIVRANTADGRMLVRKHPFVVTTLHAYGIVGSKRGVIAAINQQSGEPSAGRVRFWMHGSYVGQTHALRDGVALFNLPGEAQVFRDKRWVALVIADDQVAICRGGLPQRSTANQPPGQVLLATSTPTIRPGETVAVVGYLSTVTPATLESVADVTVEIRNATDEVVLSQSASLRNTGMFAARFDQTEKLSTGVYRLVAVHAGRVIPALVGRRTITVTDRQVEDLQVWTNMDKHLTDEDGYIPLIVNAAYPWAVERGEISGSGGVYGIRLPAAGENERPTESQRVSFDVQGDSGFASAGVDLYQLGLLPGPTAVSLGVRVRGFDGRFAGTGTFALWDPDPIHAWITAESPAPPVGEPVRFRLGWFDPTNATYALDPHLAIHGPETEHRLPFRATASGLETPAWKPQTAGEYTLRTTLQRMNNQPLVVEETVVVSAGSAPSERLLEIQSVEQSAGQNGSERHTVRFELAGETNAPVLVMLRSSEPHDAVVLPALRADEPRSATLSAPNGQAAALIAMTLDPHAPRFDEARVFGRPAPAVRVTVEAPAQVEWDAEQFEIAVTLPALDVNEAGSLLVRLIPAASAGQLVAATGETGLSTRDATATLYLSNSRTPVTSDATRLTPVATELPPPPVAVETFQAFYGGATAWVVGDAALPGTSRTYTVPRPDEPGPYTIRAWYTAADGTVATASAATVITSGVRARWHAPERLTVGDTCAAALWLENPDPIERTITVRLPVVEGLSWDDPIFWPLSIAAKKTAERTVALVLGPEEHASITLDVTASEPDDVQLTAGLGGRAVVSDTIEIRAPEDLTSAPETSGVRVVRTLLRVEGADARLAMRGESKIADPALIMDVQAVPLEPGEAVRPGAALIIRDEIRTTRPVENLTVTQHLPAVVHTMAVQPDLQTAGPVTVESRDRLQSELPRIARRVVHEVGVVAMRPGEMHLPPPRFAWRGRELPVEFEQSVDRIRVRRD